MDPSVLRALAREIGDEAIGREICDLFVAETTPRLQQLRTAVRDGDAEALRVGAHTLKGSASNVGAVAVSSAAAEIERRARAGELEDMDTVLTRLADAVELTRAALGKTAA